MADPAGKIKKVRVEASASYDVLIGSGLIEDAGALISGLCGASAAVIVSDDNVFPKYGGRLRESLEAAGLRTICFTAPHGESAKTLEVYGRLLELMCEEHVRRNDIIAALGGGAVGDLAGFAAATYQRGIRFIQLPTTLLAAVDSSVGGKTAINLESGKNQAGCFLQPSLVICDTGIVRDEPEDEFRNGCAEVIKYAMIGSEEFLGKLSGSASAAYETIEETPVFRELDDVVATCVSMKGDIVHRDEFDRGDRMLLNYGHTLAHSAEALSGYTMPHGAAVAAGMAIMARSAAAAGLCGPEVPEATDGILAKYGLPTGLGCDPGDLAAGTLSDKKADGSTLRIIVPESIGRCRVESVSPGTLLEMISAGGVRNDG